LKKFALCEEDKGLQEYHVMWSIPLGPYPSKMRESIARLFCHFLSKLDDVPLAGL
jgi:hypothetical protein